MTINVYTDGRAYKNEGSGFAVIMKSDKRVWKRSFAYGNDTVNIADLNAVKFALLSVAQPFWNKEDITIHTKSRYVASIMEMDKDGFYLKLVEANAGLVNEIRELSKERGALVVKLDSDSEEAKEVKQITVNAIKNGHAIDSRQ
jgi:ribonuclease HI